MPRASKCAALPYVESNETEMVFDHVERIAFTRAKLPLLNIQPLHDLPSGLLHIALKIQREERGFKNAKVMAHIGTNDSQSAVMACLFEWFAVSLVNYEKLIGLLSFLESRQLKDTSLVDRKIAEAARTFSNAYAERISPSIVVWRNKVAAHYAITHPTKETLWTICGRA